MQGKLYTDTMNCCILILTDFLRNIFNSDGDVFSISLSFCSHVEFCSMHTGKWFWKEEEEIKDEEKQLAEEEEETAEKKKSVEAPDDDDEDEKPEDR